MGNLKVMVMVMVMMMVAMMVMIAMMVMVMVMMVMVMMVMVVMMMLAAAAAAPTAAATVTTIATAFAITAANMCSPLLAACAHHCRQHVLTAAATATTTPCNEVGVHLVIFLAPRAASGPLGT